MARQVRFLKDRDVSTGPRTVKAFKKGTVDTLTDAQADEVVADGSAELVSDRTPSKRKPAE